ncbi:MAG TPA: uroporphyrinogen decarboxylase family protein, partial [Lentisphaeria bacterium]|nr:uroporphyrinogen decarboxylase family protein [Lentisphaeria bacterium]
AQAGVDLLCIGDDIGMQKTTMMSMDNYRQWLKPRHAAVINAAKAAKPDILVTYHSCGFIEPFIPELIEIGVDVLNPVQPECMDFAKIHAQYGTHLSFWGTLGTQTTMPFGSADEVRSTTLRNLAIAGSKGGLFCSPTHIIEPEVPWDNIEAYVQAARDFQTAGN